MTDPVTTAEPTDYERGLRDRSSVAVEVNRLLDQILEDGVDREDRLWPLIYEYGDAHRAEAVAACERKYRGMVKERDDQIHRKRVARQKVKENAVRSYLASDAFTEIDRWTCTGSYMQRDPKGAWVELQEVINVLQGNHKGHYEAEPGQTPCECERM